MKSAEISENKMSDIDKRIRVFHIGGRGGIGPSECLLKLGRKNMSFSIFEANLGGEKEDSWDYDDPTIRDYVHKYGIKPLLIPSCIYNRVGKKKFYINAMPDCSSLLKMNPDAKDYSRLSHRFPLLSDYRIIWGEISKPIRTVEVDVTTLDKLYSDKKINMPHFLSIDVQGAEYEVLEGASKILQGDLLGVVSEVEFRELYENQKLFMDQYSLLKKHKFSLFELYNTEYWHQGPILGKGDGAIVVSEALFLRDFQYFVQKYRDPSKLLSNLSKLAIVAYSFNKKSYSFEIIQYIMKNLRSEWETFLRENNNDYIRELMRFYHGVKANPPYKKIPTYAEFMNKGEPLRRPKPVFFVLKILVNAFRKLKQKKQEYHL